MGPISSGRNIEVFPTIDMAGAHGYSRPFVMEVWRNGVKVGSSGAPSTANPLELNHDGPPCWSGTTPDIIAGDQVSLELSPYDLTKGRITFRHLGKTGSGPRPPVNRAARR